MGWLPSPAPSGPTGLVACGFETCRGDSGFLSSSLQPHCVAANLLLLVVRVLPHPKQSPALLPLPLIQWRTNHNLGTKSDLPPVFINTSSSKQLC